MQLRQCIHIHHTHTHTHITYTMSTIVLESIDEDPNIRMDVLLQLDTDVSSDTNHIVLQIDEPVVEYVPLPSCYSRFVLWFKYPAESPNVNIVIFIYTFEHNSAHRGCNVCVCV